MKEIWFIRVYMPGDPRGKGNRGLVSYQCEARDVLSLVKHRRAFDAVSMLDGHVALHHFKAPLPVWLSENLLREIRLVDGKLPRLPVEPEYMI